MMVNVCVQQEPLALTAARQAVTELSRENDYAAAVVELERIRCMETAGGEDAPSHSEIRRAKYLQKAGRGAEGWQIFECLLTSNRHNLWVVIDVLNAMRLHLQRENQAEQAIRYGVAHWLARVCLYRDMKLEAEAALAGPIKSDGSEDIEDLRRQYDQSRIITAECWINELVAIDQVEKFVAALCKKAKKPDAVERLTADVMNCIERGIDPFDYLANA